MHLCINIFSLIYGLLLYVALGKKVRSDSTDEVGVGVGFEAAVLSVPSERAVVKAESAVVKFEESLDYSQLEFDNFGEPIIPEPFKAVSLIFSTIYKLEYITARIQHYNISRI